MNESLWLLSATAGSVGDGSCCRKCHALVTVANNLVSPYAHQQRTNANSGPWEGIIPGKDTGWDCLAGWKAFLALLGRLGSWWAAGGT